MEGCYHKDGLCVAGDGRVLSRKMGCVWQEMEGCYHKDGLCVAGGGRVDFAVLYYRW